MVFALENDLDRALKRAATEPAARPEFYRLLLDSSLYVIGSSDGPTDEHDHWVNAREGQHLKLPSVTHSGHEFHLVFSSLERLQAFVKKPEHYIAMKGRDLFGNTRGAYFMLNPGSDYGKELLPDEIAHLLDPAPAHRAVTIDKDTTVLIGQPREYPWALMEALSNLFKTRADVLAAWIAQIVYPDETDNPHPIVGVEAIGAWDSLSGEIGRTIDMLQLGLTVDVVPIMHDGASRGFSESLLCYPPFYQRELPVV